nr:response regulator [Chthonobacter rhizosphaerae]
MAAFDAEHREHVGVIRRALDRAASGQPVDLADVFRRAHSLKGAARAVDIGPVEDLAHRLEALVQRVIDGDLRLNAPVRAAVEQALDAIEGHVATLDGGGDPQAMAAAAEALERVEAPERAEGSPAGPEPAPGAEPEAGGEPRVADRSPAAAVTGDEPADRAPGDTAAAAGTAGAPVPEGADAPGGVPAGEGSAGLDAMRRDPAAAAPEPDGAAASGDGREALAEEAARGAEPTAPDEGSEVLRVSARQVERLGASLSLVLGEVQARQGLPAELKNLAATARSLARALGEVREPAARIAADLGRAGDGPGTPAAVARRLARRLAEVETVATALQVDLNRLAQAERRQAFSLERAATRLAEDVEGVSLVPVETVLGGLGRMVRDLARAQGLAVRFRADGFEALVDRRLLQGLKDPVLHLVRNAVGHGGEPAEARAAAGKPAEMEVAVTAAVGGGRLTLTVSDDGRGPDLARIEAVAVERGLMKPRSFGAPPPSPDRLLALVFEAGFSTAPAVDRLSGRGVGLSVVAEAVRRHRGHVELRPRRPFGTEAVLSVPLAAALQSIVVLEAAGRAYGLPSHGVERLLRVPEAALHSVEGRPAVWIEFGGQDVVVPIITLPDVLGLAAVPLPVHAGTLTVATIRRGDRRLGLAVDALKDARSMIVSAVDGFGADGRIVSGAVLTDDGLPAPVLDGAALVERWLETDGAAARGVGLSDWRPAAEAKPVTILVVDDSITTRTLEKSILEAQGYRVILSVDGLDALNALRAGEAVVDLVIADVEMPRMDGFGLLQAIRADSRFAALPVILMTSRAAPEDVRRGLDLGASAYVTKQTFDQRDLLATIGQLL